MILAVFAIVFAILGLTPSLSWIPEVPLLAVAVLVPAGGLVLAGFRGGVVAGGIAGATAGLVGGLAYVLYGKPPLNLPLGLLAGAATGALFGAVGSLVRRRVC